MAILFMLAGGGCKSSRRAVRGDSGAVSGASGRWPVSVAEEERLKVVRGSDNALVMEAAKWLGTPYRYGGSEAGQGTDCSGMTMEVYRRALGLRIPRNSAAQQEFCVPLMRDSLQAGDLVFFSSQKGSGGRVSHVGLYVDRGVFVHASTSRGVIASHLEEPYYAGHYHSAGRVRGTGVLRVEANRDSVLEVNAGVALPDCPVAAAVVPDSVGLPGAILPAPPVQDVQDAERADEEALADSIRSQVKMAF